MKRDDNMAAQERFGAAVNSGNLDAFDALVAPDAGVQVGRFDDGPLVERWDSSDQLGMSCQLGSTPA